MSFYQSIPDAYSRKDYFQKRLVKLNCPSSLSEIGDKLSWARITAGLMVRNLIRYSDEKVWWHDQGFILLFKVWEDQHVADHCVIEVVGELARYMKSCTASS